MNKLTGRKVLRPSAGSGAAERGAARSPQDARERLAHASWLSVVRAYHLCDALLARRIGALGVTLAEHEVLVNLLREDGLTQQQVADRCFSARSGTSMLVTRMEGQGWLLRSADETDRRTKRLSLTAAGRTLAQRCRAEQRDVVALMTAQADDTLLAQVQQAMDGAATALHQAL
jgi:DNA-binding MarR family transcriptional regulator